MPNPKTNAGQDYSKPSLRSLTHMASGTRRKSNFAVYLQTHDIDGDLSHQRYDHTKFLSPNGYFDSPSTQLLPGKSAERSDKLVYFGDIIYISWSIYNADRSDMKSGLLSGDKYANSFVQFKPAQEDLADFDAQGCLFQIVNLSEKSHEGELTDKQKSLIQKYNIFSLKDLKRINEVDSSSENKTRLLYGQGCSLRHVASGKYLSLKALTDSSSRADAKEDQLKNCSRFALTSDEDVDTYFKFYPTNTLSQIGSPMDYEEPVFFKDESTHHALTVQLPGSSFEEAKLTVLSKETTEWRFSFYADSSFLNSTHRENLRCGDIIQIFDAETREHLVCAVDGLSSGRNGRLHLPAERNSSGTPYIETSELGSSVHTIYPVTFAADAQNSVYSFWQVKWSRPFDNSLLTNEDQIHFVNLMTNAYLTFQSNPYGYYSLVATSVIPDNATNCFHVFNSSTMLSSNKIDTNSKFTLKARAKSGDPILDVMYAVYKSGHDNTSSAIKALKYSELSMVKLSEEHKNYLTIIHLKFSFKKLHDHFFTWGAREQEQTPVTHDDLSEKVKIFTYDQRLAEKIQYAFNEKLTEFKGTLQILRNMLLVDYSNFVDVEEGPKQSSALGAKISEQIYESHTIKILIEILNVSIARFCGMTQTGPTEATGNSTDLIRSYDRYCDFQLAFKDDDSPSRSASVNLSDNYRKLITLILKFLIRFSYKNRHIQSNILEKIETVFPILALERELVKEILGTVLAYKDHPRTRDLHLALLRRFTECKRDAYLVNVAHMYNLIAKAIKYNDASTNIDKDLEAAEARLIELADQKPKNRTSLKRPEDKWNSEEHQLLLAPPKLGHKQLAEPMRKIKVKTNTYMEKNVTIITDGDGGARTEPDIDREKDLVDDSHNTNVFSNAPHTKLADGSPKDTRHNDHERIQLSHYQTIQKEIDRLKIKKADLEQKQTINRLIHDNRAIRSRLLTLCDSSKRDSDLIPNSNGEISKKSLTETLIADDENWDGNRKARLHEGNDRQESFGSLSYEFRLDITSGRLIRRI